MKTILIVDSECASDNIAEILCRRGFNAVVVPEAQRALNAIRSGAAVDMVIMELHLPDMEGLDLLSALKRDWPGLPVLIVTASGSIESYLHAVNLGVVEYLNKPVLSRELSHIVQNVLTRPGHPGMSVDAA
jgi:DNA-binding NtrC family response regulator